MSDDLLPPWPSAQPADDATSSTTTPAATSPSQTVQLGGGGHQSGSLPLSGAQPVQPRPRPKPAAAQGQSQPRPAAPSQPAAVTPDTTLDDLRREFGFAVDPITPPVIPPTSDPSTAVVASPMESVMDPFPITPTAPAATPPTPATPSAAPRPDLPPPPPPPAAATVSTLPAEPSADARQLTALYQSVDALPAMGAPVVQPVRSTGPEPIMIDNPVFGSAQLAEGEEPLTVAQHVMSTQEDDAVSQKQTLPAKHLVIIMLIVTSLTTGLLGLGYLLLVYVPGVSGPVNPTRPTTTNTPTTPAAQTDSDSDGLSDAQEEALGTDPKRADSDRDGFTDGDEFSHGYDPLKP